MYSVTWCVVWPRFLRRCVRGVVFAMLLDVAFVWRSVCNVAFVGFVQQVHDLHVMK